MTPDIECQDCGQPLEWVNGEWLDAVGYGCTGRGEWGEVLPHRPQSGWPGLPLIPSLDQWRAAKDGRP